MTRLWIVSDLHVGAGVSWAPAIPEHDAMIVAGDLASDYMDTLLQLHALSRWSPAPIIFVPGNHDVTGAELDAWDGEHRRLLDAGVHVLSSGQSVVIDEVRFVGATLWTDWALNDREFASQSWAARHMREYQTVTDSDGEPLWPIHTSEAHDRHRGEIERVLGQRHEGPTVVVTHHAPSAKSLRPGEELSVEAAAYASDLEAMMLRYRPDLWVHGHTHHAVDYHIGATRVVSNPRGYQRDDWSEQTGWQEDLVLEL